MPSIRLARRSFIAGDKSGRWQTWYHEAIRLADVRFAEHLGALKQEEKS